MRRMLSWTSPVLLIVMAGCAAESMKPENAADQLNGTLEEVADAPPAPTLSAQVNFTQGCDDRIVSFEAAILVDGAPSSSVACTFVFDDDQVVEGCRGERAFETAGIRTAVLTVRDLGSGTGAEFGQALIVYDPFTLDVELAVPECGLSFTFTPQFAPDIDTLVAIVTPAENVTRQEGLAGVFTVDVAVAGTYSVMVVAEDERIGPICSKTVEKQVTLSNCCPQTCGGD